MQALEIAIDSETAVYRQKESWEKVVRKNKKTESSVLVRENAKLKFAWS